MNSLLYGKIISLRPLCKEDIPVWFSWFNDKHVTKYLNKGQFPNTLEKQEIFYNNLITSTTDIQLGIVAEKGTILIGIIGIHKIDWIHRKGDVSIVIGEPDYWGKGIGTEAIQLIISHAFNKINLHKLTAGVWSKNIGMIKCFLKNKFEKEGVLKESFFFQDSYLDEIRLGLLRSNYKGD